MTYTRHPKLSPYLFATPLSPPEATPERTSSPSLLILDATQVSGDIGSEPENSDTNLMASSFTPYER